MHAHERTLLGRLGFADPDRREPLHDIACRYLATKPVLDRLAGILVNKYPQQKQCYTDSSFENRRVIDTIVRGFHVTHEFEISKGHGQYRTTVGFVDVLLTAELDMRHTNVQKRRISREGTDEPWQTCDDFSSVCYAKVAVEVKATPVPIGDVIRQINLYRAYSTYDTWILASTYPLSQSQFDCLANAKILHVHLASRFQDFVKHEANMSCPSSVEV